jgi:hypothetical protein
MADAFGEAFEMPELYVPDVEVVGGGMRDVEPIPPFPAPLPVLPLLAPALPPLVVPEPATF